jgi:hypothetical protein
LLVDFGGDFVAVEITHAIERVNLPDVIFVVSVIQDRETRREDASQSLDFLGDSFFKFGLELSIARQHNQP